MFEKSCRFALVITLASISLATGAVLDGRALARIAAVSLDSSTVTKP